MKRHRLLIADDHCIVAEGIRDVLSGQHDIVSIVTDLSKLAESVHLLAPDLVLLDLSFGKHSSLPLLCSLRSTSPGVRFVVLSMHEEPAMIMAAKRSGAHAYVSKTQPLEHLKSVVSTVLASEVSLDAQAPQSADDVDHRLVGGLTLTARQYQILTQLGQGATRSAVAVQLGISAKGVDYNVQKIKSQLGVRRLVSVLAWFAEAQSSR